MRSNLNHIPAFCLLLVALLTTPLHAQTQPTPKPGDTGTLTGTVKEITAEFLLLQPATGTPQRLWFKWISPTSPLDDRSAQPTITTLNPGDSVEAQWSFDGQRRLESIKLAAVPSPAPNPPPAPARTIIPTAPQPAPAPLAATPPATPADPLPPAAPYENSTGDKVNALLDNLVATGERLLELPLFLLLAAIGLTAAAAALLFEKLTKKGRPRLTRILVATLITTAILGSALLFDRKLSRLQNEIRELRTRTSADALLQVNTPPTDETQPPRAESPYAAITPSPSHPPAVITAKVQPESPATPISPPLTPAPPTIPAKRTTFFFDQATAQKSLAARFGAVTIKPTINDSATDIISVHTTTPLAQAYFAIVDLRNPAVEIKLGFNLTTKTLTSQFARDNDCTIAINGEAGASPGPRSGLGPWQGYFAQQGKVLLREYPTIPRPYLSFDPQNRATFTPLSAPDRTLPAAPYNIIWGRLDALLNGAIQDTDPNNRQPRTAMALDQDASHLYLFVVDGRQPRYSTGFTHGEVATLLKAFGAYNAMLCDEGGSSCIYLQSTHGIANIPSDNQGQERATYTHFGIAMKK